MQLKLWIDDNNQITIDFQLQNSADNGFADGAEVIAATITNSKLSDIGKTQLFDLTGQLVDYFSRPADSAGSAVDHDWRTEWLAATRG